MTMGEKISALRRAKGYTQDELAEKLGVSAQAVSKWENDVSCPDIMQLPRLAELFGVTLQEIRRDKSEKGARITCDGRSFYAKYNHIKNTCCDTRYCIW